MLVHRQAAILLEDPRVRVRLLDVTGIVNAADLQAISIYLGNLASSISTYNRRVGSLFVIVC